MLDYKAFYEDRICSCKASGLDILGLVWVFSAHVGISRPRILELGIVIYFLKPFYNFIGVCASVKQHLRSHEENSACDRTPRELIAISKPFKVSRYALYRILTEDSHKADVGFDLVYENSGRTLETMIRL
jgi:hypothetical protein